jgi:hypothetical protein
MASAKSFITLTPAQKHLLVKKQPSLLHNGTYCDGATTLSITTFSIMTLGIMTLSITINKM